MSTTPALTRRLQTAEKAVLGVIASAALAVGGIDIVVVVQRIVHIVTDSVTTVPGMLLVDPTSSSIIQLSPAITGATIDSLTLTVDGLPGAARGWLVAAAIVGSLVVIAISAALFWVCLRLFAGRPFVTSATWAIAVLALVLVACGFATPLLTGLANAEVARFIGSDAFPPFLVTLDLGPIAWGVALGVVGGAFELGQRLQRDTEGLV